MREHERLAGALERLVADLGGPAAQGVSLVLYGSAARGDWDARRSDVNLLLVVDEVHPDSLRRLTPAIRSWHEQGFTPPLLIGRLEWRRATDVFPIELTDMQLAHRVVLGDDPVIGHRVEPSDLRRALEGALRGKLLRLRQAYVRFRDAEPVLGGFAASSASELLVLMRATAVLLGRDPGTTPEAAVAALAGELGDDSTALRSVLLHRREPEWSCPAALFAGYLAAVQHLTTLVDTTSHGAS